MIDSAASAAPEAVEDDDPSGAEIERRSSRVAEPMHGTRLDLALVQMAPEFSRTYLQTLVDAGHVRLDGRPIKTASRKVALGQTIDLDLVPTPESRAFRPEALPIDVVFEDEHLMVVNKPAGWVVHPAAGNWSGTLLNALLARHAGAAGLPRAGIVHRLDKDTSGLMVVGKTLVAVTALVRAIAARDVHRQYLALCHGQIAKDRFQVELPIGRDPVSRVRMAVVAHGKSARTDVAVLGRQHDGQAGWVSAVQCTLHTGRTHQIRVHLAAQGHPLLGDAVYGGQPAWGMHRQALHAARLAFVHPVTGLPVDLRAALPPDLAGAWARVTDAA